MGQTMLTVALPVALAWMMFTVGLTLKGADFTRVSRYPVQIIVGLAAQLIGLPLLAYGLVQVFNLPEVVAIGLWILALSPGGASSNAITHLCGGNTALSVTMTAISSVIVPFSLPLLLPVIFPAAELVLPLKVAILQLVAVTILPIGIGMLASHYGSGPRFQAFSQWASRSSLWALFFTVAITLAANTHVFNQLFSQASLVALVLCLGGMGLGVAVARGVLRSQGDHRDDQRLTRTLAIEVGVQNAGTAIFVAVVQLQQPELALTPLLYGVLMNIPVLIMIYWHQRDSKVSPVH